VGDSRDLLVIDLNGADWSLAERASASLESVHGVVIGVGSDRLPPEAAPVCELMTTVLAPGGPGAAWVAADARALQRIEHVVSAAPRAAAVLAQVLRLTSRAGLVEGIAAESHAYSMLLASAEFRRWRACRPVASAPPDDGRSVRLERDGDLLRVILDRPERRNAFSRSVRDGLLEGIDLALCDRSIAQVVLSGAGPAFCSGGDLDEFGTAQDVGEAHRVRMRAHAGLALSRLTDRLTVQLHGACVGAGIELPAFAGKVIAREGTWFQLPELLMGLIPGAGGTVSLERRIGRWRTAYLALTADRLDLETALAWGLVDDRG
jgi:hypothetical protein